MKPRSWPVGLSNSDHDRHSCPGNSKVMPPFGAAKQNANSQAELKRYCKARAEALSLGDPKNLS